ncbi:hypothetical protein LTR74_018803 [Friedmanniomyces endolithicus]|nr:hypothetical protein LTR74_018803 [Friedmanniomyces endolithicus]
MARSEASISSELADEARKELERDNQEAISAARATATRTSTPLNLKTPAGSAKLQAAYTDFAAAFRAAHSGSSLKNPQPLLFLSRPPMHKASPHGDSACLALGKIGGGDAEELQKGQAFAWRKGEKQEFGDVDAIYIWFQVEQSSA